MGASAVLELIGRYRILEQIGEGAMADVYRAYDPHIDRPLAVKVLKEEFRQDREYAVRFLREARAAGALSHPGIVTIFDVGEIDGYPFIVMELLDGEPLSEVMKRGRQTPEQVVRIALRTFQHGRGPTVVTGAKNRLGATGYRFVPRAVMARVSARTVRSD